MEKVYFESLPAITVASHRTIIPSFDDLGRLCYEVIGPYDKLYDNYVELFAYLEKEGYKIADAPRAVYIDGIWNQEDADKWLTIIQVPVEKA